MSANAFATVLVTRAGSIGCPMADKLTSTAERWVAFDVMHPQVREGSRRQAALSESAELVVGDVPKPEDWDALLAQVAPDVVINLAAYIGALSPLMRRAGTPASTWSAQPR